MARHPWNRLLAWIVDWACVLLWAVVTAVIGVPLYLAGLTPHLSVGALNVLAAIVLIVPVTFVLAALESTSREGTLGKRLRRLRVVDSRTGERVSYPRALARNALKIALPWAIGHAAVFGIVEASASGTVPPPIWVVTALAYVLPIVYVVSLFIGTGRTPYDHLTRTSVARLPAE